MRIARGFTSFRKFDRETTAGFKMHVKVYNKHRVLSFFEDRPNESFTLAEVQAQLPGIEGRIVAMHLKKFLRLRIVKQVEYKPCSIRGYVAAAYQNVTFKCEARIRQHRDKFKGLFRDEERD